MMGWRICWFREREFGDGEGVGLDFCVFWGGDFGRSVFVEKGGGKVGGGCNCLILCSWWGGDVVRL